MITKAASFIPRRGSDGAMRRRVVAYILSQLEHHSKKTFKEEYLDLLKNLKYDMTSNIYSTRWCQMRLLTESGDHKGG